MKSILLFSIVCAISFQGLRLAAAEEACNEYVDKIIQDLKEDKEYMQDPYEIAEKSVEVHKKILLVNYTGEAKLYDGHIYGLSSLHRQGDVVVDKKDKTHLKLWLAAGVLELKCSGRLKLMGHGPQLTVEAKADLVTMKLDIVPAGENDNPKIKNFSLEDVKGLDVKVSGLGPLKFFLNAYINIVGKIFKNAIRHFVENKMKLFLDKKMKQYEIPKECIGEAFRRSLLS